MREGLTEAPGPLQAADTGTPVDLGSSWGRPAAFLCAVLFALVAGSLGENFFWVSDAGHYLRLAQGDPGVLQPFASRQLGPLIVRAAAALLHISLEHAFIAQGVISLLVLAGFVFFFAVRRNELPDVRQVTPGWLLASMAILPFWPEIFHGLALPDLWYAALLAVFLLLLAKERWLPAACMMLPLMLSRESTSLTLVCLLVAGWRELRAVGRIVAVGATALGAFVTARLTAGGPGNVEHLPGFLYLLLKVPWNFVRLLGIRPWSDQYPLLCAVPRWQISLPIGAMKAVGVCSLSSTAPGLALYALTSIFGVLPLVAFWMWRRLAPTWKPSLILRFALLYGGVSFVLAPVLGVSYARLFGYAWPLPLVVLPALAADPGVRSLFQNRKARSYLLLALHTIAAAAWFVHFWWSVWVSVAAWIAVSVLLSRTTGKGPGNELAPKAV